MEEDRRPNLSDGEVSLRTATEADVDAILAVTRDPGVVPWWAPETREETAKQLEVFSMIERGGEVIGVLQSHEERYEEYPSVAFDISLNTAGRGRGYGPAALRLAIAHYARLGHHRFTIDPAVENERAIAAYAAVGFRPVGILRSYERVEGGWRDGLLMDLLTADVDWLPDERKG
jgi:aminoglycoside 6'-N-acetyltransferase